MLSLVLKNTALAHADYALCYVHEERVVCDHDDGFVMEETLEEHV